MTLLEKLQEAQADLEQIMQKVEAGEGSTEDLEAATEEVKSLQAKIKAADEAEKLMASFKAPVEEKAEKEEKKDMARNIGEHVVEAVKASNINPKQKFNLTAPAFKTATVMDTPSSISPAITDVDKRIVEGYRRPLLIADLFSTERISGNALTYFVESSTVEGAPAITTEGYEKPMVSFGDPTAVTVALKKIASYMKETDELVEDAPWLADAINGRGMYLHELTVENYLVSTLAATSGIGTGSSLTADDIFKAMMTVQNNSGFAADAIVINPTDYQTLRLAKDGNSQYYGGGYFYGAYGNTPIAEQPSLWGLRTVVTSAVAAGTCFVGAFKMGGSIVRKNSGVTVDIANTNEDDFIKNLITILIEERLALAIRRPSAFVKITDSSTSTSTSTQ